MTLASPYSANRAAASFDRGFSSQFFRDSSCLCLYRLRHSITVYKSFSAALNRYRQGHTSRSRRSSFGFKLWPVSVMTPCYQLKRFQSTTRAVSAARKMRGISFARHHRCQAPRNRPICLAPAPAVWSAICNSTMKQGDHTMTDTKKPEKTFRIGRLSATIWLNEGNEGTKFYSVDIVRNYKDKDGNWKTTSSFSHDELLNVAILAKRAEQFIAETA
jgi:hypothetical protein